MTFPTFTMYVNIALSQAYWTSTYKARLELRFRRFCDSRIGFPLDYLLP